MLTSAVSLLLSKWRVMCITVSKQSLGRAVTHLLMLKAAVWCLVILDPANALTYMLTQLCAKTAFI